MTKQEATLVERAVAGGHFDEEIDVFYESTEKEDDRWRRYAGDVNAKASALLGRDVLVFYVECPDDRLEMPNRFQAAAGVFDYGHFTRRGR